MEREDIASYVSTEQFVSKLAKRIRSENSRKRGPNEAPLPHPQVSGGLGLSLIHISVSGTISLPSQIGRAHV